MRTIRIAAVALAMITGCVGAQPAIDGADNEQDETATDEAALDSSLSGLAAWAQSSNILTSRLRTDGAGNAYFLGQDSTNDEQWVVVKLDPYGKEVMRRVLPNAYTYFGVGNDGSMAFVSLDHNTDTRDFGCGPKTGPFVVKLAADGSCLWHRVNPGGDMSVAQVDIADNGDVVAAGDIFGPTADIGGGSETYDSQLAVVRYGADGSYKWSRKFGEARAGRRRSLQGVNGLALDSAGKVYFGGFHYASIDFGGGTMSSPMNGAPPGSAYMAVLDADGNFVRQGTYGSSAQVMSLDVRPDGRAVIAGRYTGDISFSGTSLTSGSLDVFVTVFNPDGTTRWAKKLYGTQSVDIGGVGIDANGYVSIAGATSVFSTTSGTFNVGPNHFTLNPNEAWGARFTPGTGATKWAKIWRSTTTPPGGYETGFVDIDSAVVTPNNGRLLIAGRYGGRVDFGRSKVLEGVGNFIARIYP